MDIVKPTLLINKKKCLENIAGMHNKAIACNTAFRPHFKTHQSAEVGKWFARSGIDKITVSSLTMAEYFAASGWKDILVAIPFNIREIKKANFLNTKIKLHLTVESIETLTYLQQHLQNPVKVYVEIDNGYNRTGIKPTEIFKIENIIEKIIASPKTDFAGFLTHAGNTYMAKNKKEILEINKKSFEDLELLKSHFSALSDNIIISSGDTPACSITERFNEWDEIRPGNFVYFDIMQYYLGSCNINDIAVALACPVIAKYPERHEMVVYGGAIHLSKERLQINDNQVIFGHIVNLQNPEWQVFPLTNYVSSVSQEHGILRCSKSIINSYSIGDLIGILPVHSCLTMNLMRNDYLIVD